MLRNYNNCDPKIREFYKKQRKNQNYHYSKKMINKYCVFKNKCSFWELFDKLQITDVSDPDISLKNFHHLYQTAEGIRKARLPEWMQLVGLIPVNLNKFVFCPHFSPDKNVKKPNPIISSIKFLKYFLFSIFKLII